MFLTFVTLAVTAAVYVLGRLLLRPARPDASVAAGALAVPLLLGVLTALALPAFSYVFAWPTLAGIGLLGWTVLGSSAATRPWPWLVGLSVAALVVVTVAVVPRVPDLLGFRCAGKRATVADIPGPRGADCRRTEPGARVAPALPCPTTPLDDSRRPGRVGRRVPWRAARFPPGSMPTHHSPTTSNTASTPTQGRPPGSAQGAVQTTGPGSSSPTAMRRAAPPSHPGTTSTSSTTS